MKKILFVFLPLLIAFGCRNKGEENNAVSGKINIVTDESFLTLLKAETDIFLYIYKNAAITTSSLPESDAIHEFVEGKADMALVSRNLSDNEKEVLKSKNIFPESYKIASDGIVLIVNAERSDTSLSLDQLKKIFNGNITKWKDLGSKEGDAFVIAFDHSNSANLLFINEKFPLSTDKIKIFAAGSNQKVIDYVKVNKEAIGVIGLSFISEEPAFNEDLKKLRVLSVLGNDGKSYSPWQQDLSTGKYPLKRDLFLLNKYKSGLGTGFAVFALGEEGQRIVLKAGLLPGKMPGREVIFVK